MENDASSKRLEMLDGLRGFAILLVFLTHIDSSLVTSALPNWLQPIGLIITGSGRTAVSLFFLLTGFLMAYLYPTIQNNTSFLQKRYTRIFPLFLSLVITRILLRNIPTMPLLARCAAFLLPALVIHGIWVYGIKKRKNMLLSRGLFWTFVGVQVTAIALNVLWISRMPPLYFNQLLSPFWREASIGLINATLTLPFGTYIPQLDGVYWSLISEVLFYILYPLLFVPIIMALKQKSLGFQVIFIFAVAGLLMGIAQLSHRIWGAFILDIPFFSFFVAGIIIAHIYRENTRLWEACAAQIEGSSLRHVPLLLFFGVFALLHYLFKTHESATDIIRILSAFVIAPLFAVMLMKKSSLSAFFQLRPLTYLGAISYSAYLIHTSVVDTFKVYWHPTTALESLVFVLLAFAVVCVASVIAHELLEKPYFIRQKKASKEAVQVRRAMPVGRVLGVVCGIYVVSVFFGYQSNFNLFSEQHVHSAASVIIPASASQQKLISMKNQQNVRMRFTANQTNLGVVTMNLRYMSEPSRHETGARELQFRIREVGSKQWYSTSKYKISEIGVSEQHPFGFPTIADSKDRSYEVDLQLLGAQKHQYLVISLEDSALKSVYQIDKAYALRHPQEILSLGLLRVHNVVFDVRAQRAMLYFCPFFLASLVLLRRPKHTPSK